MLFLGIKVPTMKRFIEFCTASNGKRFQQVICYQRTLVTKYKLLTTNTNCCAGHYEGKYQKLVYSESFGLLEDLQQPNLKNEGIISFRHGFFFQLV